MNDIIESWLQNEPVREIAKQIRLEFGDNDMYALCVYLHDSMDSTYKQQFHEYYSELVEDYKRLNEEK